MTQIENLKTLLDRANVKVVKLTRRDLRAGTGPSVEFKTAYKAATKAWREWCNALDISEGRAPCFPTT